MPEPQSRMREVRMGDVAKAYGSYRTHPHNAISITPSLESVYEGRIAIVTDGTFFEHLAWPIHVRKTRESAVLLLAIHRPGCVIGASYRGKWPEDIRLGVWGGSVLLRAPEGENYSTELEKQARSTAQALRLNLKPAEVRVVAGAYLLAPYQAAYNLIIAEVMGISPETVSRTLTKLIGKGLLSKREASGPITLRDGALEKVGLSTQELSDLVHEC